MQHLTNITSESCTGCSACAAVCPKRAIEMTADDKGFYIPRIKQDACVDCGQCASVCPAIDRKPLPPRDNKAYAVNHRDIAVREHSASGALFQAAARDVLENGGYVCGCVLEDLEVRHIVSNKLEDVARMADSKYVQSNMADCFPKIASLLRQGEMVLFSGCSCQVHGLLKFLSAKNISDEKLLTMDLICHGVPSPKIWRSYIEFYELKTGRTVADFRWRSKKYTWGGYMVLPT